MRTENGIVTKVCMPFPPFWANTVTIEKTIETARNGSFSSDSLARALACMRPKRPVIEQEQQERQRHQRLLREQAGDESD